MGGDPPADPRRRLAADAEGLERVGVSGNDAVLVTGLGPVGLATAMLAKAMGASRLVGIDVLPERLELARSLSLFDDVLPAGPDNVAAVRALTGGLGADTGRATEQKELDRRLLR